MDSVISRVIYDNAFCAIKEPENSNEPKTGRIPETSSELNDSNEPGNEGK